jgi:DNA helicase-2/ATP-dependent DNA helicase PcrA
MNTVLKFPKAPTSDGQFGNAIHETLESLQHTLRRDGELPDTEQAIEIFTAKLKAKKLSQSEFERLQGRGAQALQHFLPWWWHNFVPEAQAEFNFRHEGSFVGIAHLTGNLDQILVDTDTRTMRVVDFKTGKTHSRWTNEVKTHKYKQQLIFYKLLVENSHSFKGYEVDEAKLVFVEPDVTSGDMNELPIVFNKDEIERTKLLITAVWQRITTLDLPDTNQYSKDLKGVFAFEDWLIANI